MKRVKLIEITGPACGVCKMIKGVVDKVVSEFSEDLEYTEICADNEENMKFAAQHNVRSVPVFLFYKGEELVHRHQGAINYIELKKKIQEILDK